MLAVCSWENQKVGTALYRYFARTKKENRAMLPTRNRNNSVRLTSLTHDQPKTRIVIVHTSPQARITTHHSIPYAFGSTFPFLIGTTPPSIALTGVCVPVPAAGEPAPAAGVPSPLKGVTMPLGGTGILMSSGLLGTSFCDRPSIWIRLAAKRRVQVSIVSQTLHKRGWVMPFIHVPELLYDAGMISMISSRGNCRLGMSVAEQAIR